MLLKKVLHVTSLLVAAIDGVVGAVVAECGASYAELGIRHHLKILAASLQAIGVKVYVVWRGNLKKHSTERFHRKILQTGSHGNILQIGFVDSFVEIPFPQTRRYCRNYVQSLGSRTISSRRSYYSKWTTK